MIGAVAVAPFFRFLGSVVAMAQLLAVGVGLGREFGSVASDVEVIEIDELQVDGAGDEASIEEGLQGSLPDGEDRDVAVCFQDGSQRGGLEGPSQDAVSQAVDDVLMGPQVVLVLVLVGLVPLVAASVGPACDGAGLAGALQ